MRSLSHEEAAPGVILEYFKVVTEHVEYAIQACTPHGHGLKLKVNKPEDPYFAYIWRQARYKSGEDTQQPHGCYHELSDAIANDFGVEINFLHTFKHESHKKILEMLDGMADELLKSIGVETRDAAKRWNRVAEEVR